MGVDSKELPDVLSGQEQSAHIYTDDSWLKEHQPLTDRETEWKMERDIDSSLVSLWVTHFHVGASVLINTVACSSLQFEVSQN